MISYIFSLNVFYFNFMTYIYGKHDRNIVNIIQIVITPPCNLYSFVKLNYKFCKRISPFIGEKSNNYIVIVIKFKIISSLVLDIITKARYQIEKF